MCWTQKFSFSRDLVILDLKLQLAIKLVREPELRELFSNFYYREPSFFGSHNSGSPILIFFYHGSNNGQAPHHVVYSNNLNYISPVN
jgi:hypothetical protein